MKTSNYNCTDSQKESCAVSIMRDAIKALSLRNGISYEDALLRFTSSKVYGAMFDYDTGSNLLSGGTFTSLVHSKNSQHLKLGGNSEQKCG